MSKQFIKHPYSISRATPIDSDCCRLPTASVLGNKTDTYIYIYIINKPKFLKATYHTEIGLQLICSSQFFSWSFYPSPSEEDVFYDTPEYVIRVFCSRVGFGSSSPSAAGGGGLCA